MEGKIIRETTDQCTPTWALDGVPEEVWDEQACDPGMTTKTLSEKRQTKVELYKDGVEDDAHKIELFSNSSTENRTVTQDIPFGMHKVVITYTPQSVPEDTYGIRFWWKKGSY